MPLLVPFLARIAEPVRRAAETLKINMRDAARTRREHVVLRDLDAMNDDRLYDLGFSREAIRCGLAAAHRPLSVARACRERPVGGLNSRRWGSASDARPFQRERYLGW